jgi:hypothetical protein
MRRATIWANMHQDDSSAILARYTKLSTETSRTMTRATYDSTPLTGTMLQPVIDAAAKYGTLEHAFNGNELLASTP